MKCTISKLMIMAALFIFLNGCTPSARLNCAPVITSYAADSENYPELAKDATKFYRVKKDDTLYAISQLFNLDYRQLAQWNRIAPPFYTIEIGQKIRLSDPIWGNRLTQDYR